MTPIFKKVLVAISALSLTATLPQAYAAAAIAWMNADATGQWSPRSGHTSVVFDNKMWVLGGSESEDVLNDAWSSTNGKHWTLVSDSAEWSPRVGHTSVVFDDRMWVLGGRGKKNDVWASTDGVGWDLITESAPWPGRSGHSSVVFDDKIWVLGGIDENINLLERVYFNDVWYSEDGAQWASATLEAPWLGRTDHSCVNFGGRMWVIGGEMKYECCDIPLTLGDVWSSQDGKTWTMATDISPWISRAGHTSLVIGDNLWLFGGIRDTGFAGPIFNNNSWFSPNGVDWTQSTISAEWPGREGHSSLAFGGKIWVFGGYIPTGPVDDVWYASVPTNQTADLNGDGLTNYVDLFLFYLQWGSNN